MNFVEGQLAGGRFDATGVSLPTAVRGDASRAVLGLRPEDCRIAREGGAIRGEVYATELIGDHTLVTVKVGDAMMTVKAPKDFDKAVGAILGIDADAPAAYLFEATTGARLR